MTITHSHNTTRSHKSGFTLVELTVVVSIIILLATIAVPALIKVKNLARQRASEALIINIDTAVRQYRNDFKDYPPAGDATLSSAELLYFLMTGYANDEDRDGQAGSGAGYYSDDGCQGYGFRRYTDPRGKKFGPYNNLEEATRGGSGNWVFIDSFDRTVEYAKYNGASFDGHSSLNVAYAAKPSGGICEDFILTTSGRDGTFEGISTNPDTDDPINFLLK